MLARLLVLFVLASSGCGPSLPDCPPAYGTQRFAGAAGENCNPIDSMMPDGMHPDLGPSGLRFAVVGDFGVDTLDERRVADLIHGWAPDFVVTVGDNNYHKASDYDRVIGKYYARYIGGYNGAYGPGSLKNRLWPALGNHDWDARPIQAWYDFFSMLPGNKRYYDVVEGRVHLFFIDSDPREPDGVRVDSTQALWLKQALAASTACHKLVVFHHPPYSSGEFQVEWMRWPFKEWGADAVLTGHEHFWERLSIDGIPYLVDGLGGALNRFQFPFPNPASQFRYNADFGAMLVTVDTAGISYEFFDWRGQRQDALSVPKTCS